MEKEKGMRIVQSRKHKIFYASFSVLSLAMGAFILYPFFVKNNFTLQQVLMHLVSGGFFICTGMYGVWLSYNMRSNYIEFNSEYFKLRWITERSDKFSLPKIEEIQGAVSDLRIMKVSGSTKVQIQNRSIILDRRQQNATELLEPISKIVSGQDYDCSQFNEPKKVGGLVFPSATNPSKVLHPGEDPLNFPTPSISPQFSSILRFGLHSTHAMR